MLPLQPEATIYLSIERRNKSIVSTEVCDWYQVDLIDMKNERREHIWSSLPIDHGIKRSCCFLDLPGFNLYEESQHAHSDPFLLTLVAECFWQCYWIQDGW